MQKIPRGLRSSGQSTYCGCNNCMQGGIHSKRERSDMLNLYAVTVWHSSAPRDIETIEVRTYSAGSRGASRERKLSRLQRFSRTARQ